MIEQLEVAVIQWADKKGILTQSTPLHQLGKTQEELDELVVEVEKEDHDAIQLELGDVLVTLVIQANMHGLCLGECLAAAYSKISKRTGRMDNGVFVKDAHL